MATWGEFIREINVITIKPGVMHVKVDEVIDLFEERNRLRQEVARLQAELANAREACCKEVEEYALAFEQEGGEYADILSDTLRRLAQVLRESGRETPPEAEVLEAPDSYAESLPVAEVIDSGEGAAPAEPTA
jgi:hypothetical protein